MEFLNKCIEKLNANLKIKEILEVCNDINKCDLYLANITNYNLQDICNFLKKIRLDNPIFSIAISQIKDKLKYNNKSLSLCNYQELYQELINERPRLIMKGIFELNKIKNNLNENELSDLKLKIVSEDVSIFNNLI